MRRLLLSCFVVLSLLAATALRAGDWSDVPLSVRSLAPIPGIAGVFGVPGEGAILSIFRTTEQSWIQRIDATGNRLDREARSMPDPVWTASRNGDGWLLAAGSPVTLTRVGPDGVPAETVQTSLQPQLKLLETSEGMFLTRFSPLETYRVTRDLELQVVQQTPVGGSLADAAPLVLDRGVGTAWLVWKFIPSGTSTIQFFHRAGTDGIEETHEVVVEADGGAAAFVPSPEGGGLFVWSDSGVRGMVLRRDGSLTPPLLLHSIDRPAVSLQGVASEDGWTIVEHGASAIEVGSDGTARRTFTLPEGSSHVALPGPDLALRQLSAGFHILIESAAGWLEFGVGGTALTVQGQVRVAEHGGTALAIWPEQSFAGALLRATRLLGGIPLDGPGIPSSNQSRLSPFYATEPSQHDVVWDGDTYLVAWTEGENRRLFVRRVAENGWHFPAEVIAEEVHQVRLASDGRGGAMAVWIANAGAASIRVEAAAIDRGRPGPVVTLAERQGGSRTLAAPSVAWTGSSYVALWDEAYVCRILCPYMGNVFARAVSRDGVPAGEEVLAARDVATSGQVVEEEGRIFALLQFNEPSGLAELRSDLTFVTPVATPFDSTFSQLRLGERELFVDRSQIRAVYSTDRHPLRYETLPIDLGEILSAQVGPRFIVSTAAVPPRSLVIRTPGLARRADLSVTTLDSRWLSGLQVQRFLIVNRGPDAVVRTLLLPSDRMFFGDEPLYFQPLPVELPPGSSAEISVAMSPYRPAQLCVAGDAQDLVPENNCAGGDERKRPVRRSALH